MDENRFSYNRIADEWAASRNNSFLSKLVSDFAAKLKPKGKVLDIGCGTGYPIAKYLSEQGFELTGIDITENMLQKAIELHLSNTKFYLRDFFHFDPKEKYDGVIAFDSFFHFPKEKQRDIYPRLVRWMNKGAYLLFSHGNVESEIRDEMFGETFYYSALDTKEVRAILKQQGFEIEWSIEDYHERDMDKALVILARKIS